MWFRKEATMSQETPQISKSRSRTKAVVNPPQPLDEVPVHRVAEYIPASFIAGADDDDVLHDREARLYKTNDQCVALVFNAGVLEFNIEALEKACERARTMSDTDIAEILGLVEDEEDEPELD